MSYCRNNVLKKLDHRSDFELIENNDIDKIKKWRSYIADDTASANNCSFEGRLVFKVYEDSTVMKFSLKPGCQVVTYSLDGMQYTKSFTTEGINYLEGLKKVE